MKRQRRHRRNMRSLLWQWGGWLWFLKYIK